MNKPTVQDIFRHFYGNSEVYQKLLNVSCPNLPQIMEVLYQKKIQSLLVEGGSILLQSFIDSGLWDEAFIEKAPLRLNNGIQAPSIQKKHFKLNKIYFGREIMHAVHSQIQR